MQQISTNKTMTASHKTTITKGIISMMKDHHEVPPLYILYNVRAQANRLSISTWQKNRRRIAN